MDNRNYKKMFKNMEYADVKRCCEYLSMLRDSGYDRLTGHYIMTKAEYLRRRAKKLKALNGEFNGSYKKRTKKRGELHVSDK